MSAPGRARIPDDSTPELQNSPQVQNRPPADPRETIALVYPELRRIAQSLLRRERKCHTLQPTALANEALTRLLERQAAGCDPRQLLAYGMREMRTILIDSGRRYRVRHRIDTVTNPQWSRNAGDTVEDLAHLHLLLERLDAIDPRAREVAELRYFVGLSIEETAEFLSVSRRTVSLDWKFARCWLAEQWDSA